YFVFGDNSMRVVVTAMLWIEVIFILINGAILWLLLRRSSPQEMTAAERFAQSAELLQANRRGKT
ncbi:MAG TPA: hypothetical protein VMV87_16760, partial [Burkholderiales bacterium]|nr:hypothetical protein [Burkholderiales bacterium]